MLDSSPSVVCCTSPRALRGLLARSPATVVQIRVLPVPSMFDVDLLSTAGALPFDLACAVAPPSVAEDAGIVGPCLGDVLVFAGERLLGRLGAKATNKGQRVIGLLTAGLAPWLASASAARSIELPRRDVEAHSGSLPMDDDHSDPFAVLGVPDSAPFDEVHAMWRQRLVEYHPDRFEKAGEKIRQLAQTETQRLNAAFQAISRQRHARSRS